MTVAPDGGCWARRSRARSSSESAVVSWASRALRNLTALDAPTPDPVWPVGATVRDYDRPRDDRSRDEEVERLLALGATHADVGQTGEESWTVLADPEGNEFCVLRSLAPGHFSL